MSRKLFYSFCYPFSLMSFSWKQSKRHCKEILIHTSCLRRNHAFLQTDFALMSALWKLTLQDRRGTRTVHHSRTHPGTQQGCLAQFGYELHMDLPSVCGITGTAQWRGCVSFSRTPYSGTTEPLLLWEGKWCIRCQRWSTQFTKMDMIHIA